MSAAADIPSARQAIYGRRTWVTVPRVVLLLLACTVFWANMVVLDVVAVATGVVVADRPTNSVKLGTSGILHRIHVAEGDTVSAGQVLVELDQSALAVRLEQARRLARQHRSESARLTALLATEGAETPLWPGDLTAEERGVQQDLFAASAEHVANLYATRASEAAELADRLEVLRRQRQFHLTTLAALEGELAIRERLESTGVIASASLLSLRRERDETAIRVAISEAEISAGERALETHTHETAWEITALRLEWRTARDAAEKLLDAVLVDIAALKEECDLSVITAPFAGTVQDLVVFTPGEPMAFGDLIMRIIPDSQRLRVDAYILNRDIGFVREGQPVAVKFEAFPFTRYGSIEGHIASVSRDVSLRSTGPAPLANLTSDVDSRSASALQESYMQAAIYRARVDIAQQAIQVDGRAEPLRPGMTVTVDIVTDQRSLVQFFTAPLSRYLANALRER